MFKKRLLMGFASAILLLFGLNGSTPLLAQTNPNPLQCKKVTSICKFALDGFSVDTSCQKLPTSLTIPNGAVDPTGNAGEYNDGTQCGQDDKHKPCGDFITKSGTCGDTGPPNFGPPVGGGGGGGDSCDYDGDGNFDCYAYGARHSQKAAEVRLRTVAKQSLPASVERLVQQLARLDSVHLKSRVLMWEPADNSNPARSSITEYEYWEAGGRYRIHTYIDPKMGFHDIPDVSFDGTHYQMAQRMGMDLMLIKAARNERMMPLPIDNPLLLAVAFASPEDEHDCLFCELRLSDLRFLMEARVGRPPAPETPALVTNAPLGTAPSTFELTGGHKYGHATAYRVALDAAGRVQRIRLVTEREAVLADIAFSDYRAVAGSAIELPRHIQLNRSDDQGKPWLTLNYVIDTVEANMPVDDARFVLPESAAALVWDDDLRTYTKKVTLSTQGLCSSKN